MFDLWVKEGGRTMKKKLALCIGVGLIICLFYMYISFQGNFLSKIIIQYKSLDYVEERFPTKDYEFKDVIYNFKDGYYYARYQSPTMQDEYFSLAYHWYGNFIQDDYENVVNKWNTWSRLEMQYRKYVELVLQKEEPYHDIRYGTLKSLDDMSQKEKDEMILNKEYDISELGKKYGSIVYYVNDQQVNIDKVCEYLMKIKKSFDQNNVTFYSIDFVLENNNERLELISFLYKDIDKDGFKKKVQENIEKTKDYYKQLEKQK